LDRLIALRRVFKEFDKTLTELLLPENRQTRLAKDNLELSFMLFSKGVTHHSKTEEKGL